MLRKKRKIKVRWVLSKQRLIDDWLEMSNINLTENSSGENKNKEEERLTEVKKGR